MQKSKQGGLGLDDIDVCRMFNAFGYYSTSTLEALDPGIVVLCGLSKRSGDRIHT